MSRFAGQSGVALVSAMLVLSLAGILGAGRMFTLQMESQSARSLIGNTRGRLLALGVEDLAREALTEDALAGDTDHTGEVWAQAIDQTIPGEATLQGALRDMQGRFNVNNLVTVQGTADMIAVAQLQRLLRVLQLDEYLAFKALDWIDADNLPQQPAGAEDEAYTNLDPPYQAPNRALEDISELLAVEGFDVESWRILSGHVTALPLIAGPTAVNLNTATEPVLLSLADNLDPALVQLWLDQRETGGIRDLGEVQRALPSEMADRVALGSSWFLLQQTVTTDGGRFFLGSLLDRETGQVRTRWRRQGIPAEAWLAPLAEQQSES